MRTAAPLRLQAALLLLFVVGLPARAAAADRAAGPQSGARGFIDEIAVAWVLAPAVVRSHSGYVSGLSRDDFRLRVDGRSVPIASFDSGIEAPVSLIYLQDLSGSMASGGKLAASRRALGDLVAVARASDELALASFAGGRLSVDVPFTAAREVFAEAMELWHPYGVTALHDAVAWIPEIGDEGRHAKRAVVLVTDGVDNSSTIAPEDARRTVEEARLPVFVLGLGAAGGGEGTYAALLAQLALATGGRYFAVADPAAIGEAIAAIVADLRAQYVLGFPAADGGPRHYRRFEVDVRGRGLEVVHRIGYHGGPPAAWADGDPGKGGASR